MSSQQSQNASRAALEATSAYVEGCWDLVHQTQKSIVLRGMVEYIEEKINPIINDPNAPDLTPLEAADLETWRKKMKPDMRDWVNSETVDEIEEQLVELAEAYKESRLAMGLSVYEEPRFVVNPLESDERLEIQKYFDVEREVLIMNNPETYFSHQNVIDLRAATSKGRVVYHNCPLMTQELSVANELQAIRSASNLVNWGKSWVPARVAELVGTERCGMPDDEEDAARWNTHFDLMGKIKIEEIARDLGVDQQQQQQATQHQVQQQPQQQVQQPGPGQLPANPPVTLISRHGAPRPYNPTIQPPQTSASGAKTKWHLIRGNTPGNVDVFVYDKQYNTTDSKVGKSDNAKRKRYRESGETRDIAIDRLIEKGELPVGFRDVSQ